MSKRSSSETALYVRLPATAGEKLDRASEALGIPKKDLVAGLVSTYVDPDSQRGTTLGHRGQIGLRTCLTPWARLPTDMLDRLPKRVSPARR